MDDTVEPLRRYFAALNAGDLDSLVGAFTEDVVVMAPDTRTTVGLGAARAMYAERLSTWAYERELHVDETIARRDVAVIRCHTTGSLTRRADGRRLESASREVFVVERRDGRWVIRWYMFNPPGAHVVVQHGVA